MSRQPAATQRSRKVQPLIATHSVAFETLLDYSMGKSVENSGKLQYSVGHMMYPELLG